MSVLLSKRNLSKAEFVKSATHICNETVAFCSELVFLDEEKRNEYRVNDTLKDFFEAKPVESYLMNV